jgi:ABC-type branched-subunit amino acid transport system ATPase component
MSATASAGAAAGTVTPVIEAVDLSVGYGHISVIREMNLSVRPGEVVALVGPNGAGKTTTLNALGGYLPALSGTVRWKGQNASGAPHRRAKDGLAFVNEARSVLRRLTTRQNLKLAGTDEAACLDLFPELRARLNTKAGDLSGGEQQMLSVGRALASNPVMLMADELSLGLAPKVTERLLKAVRAAADTDNVGVLLVEQHLNNALRFADRICLIISGRIEFDGRPAQLEQNESSLVAAYLSGDTDALREIAQDSQAG